MGSVSFAQEGYVEFQAEALMSATHLHSLVCAKGKRNASLEMYSLWKCWQEPRKHSDDDDDGVALTRGQQLVKQDNSVNRSFAESTSISDSVALACLAFAGTSFA